MNQYPEYEQNSRWLLAKKPMFLNDFNFMETPEFTKVDMVYQEFDDKYESVAKLPNKYLILFADYTYEDYSGDAYVLGFDYSEYKFFEVHGGHCSCYGLEDQWSPEYYDDFPSLMAVINARDFTPREPWYREAKSSPEFRKWLDT